MGYKMKVFASLMVIGFLFSGCSEDDVKDIIASQADPVPGATANLVITMAPEAMLGMMTALLPPSGGLGPTGFTALSTLRDKNCGTAGNVVYDEVGNDFTATITECADENVVINGTATGTIGPTVTCGLEELPTSMDSTFNGTVVVDGETLVFTDFGVNATGITYGPDCDLVGGSFLAALTGNVSGTISGATLDIDFGTSSLDVDVTSIVDPTGLGDGAERVVTMTINGTMTVKTPCKNGSLTIATITPLKTEQPNVCPVSGEITISGDFGDTITQTFNGSCDLVACVL